MLHSRLFSGHTFGTIFSKLKLPYVLTAWIYLNSVNGISLPIIHTIDMHHHKQGKSFLQVPICGFLLTARAALRMSALAIRFSALIARAAHVLDRSYRSFPDTIAEISQQLYQGVIYVSEIMTMWTCIR